VLDRGPIGPALHGLLDYLLAAVLIVAPLILDFDHDAATAISIAAGAGELVVAACTAWSRGIFKLIPPRVHGVLDYVLTLALIATPFVAGFSDDTTALVYYLVLGGGGLAATAATRFESDLHIAGDLARR